MRVLGQPPALRIVTMEISSLMSSSIIPISLMATTRLTKEAMGATQLWLNILRPLLQR